jgi:hypothetical protein
MKIARMSCEELDDVEMTIYRQLQNERYSKAYETLQLGRPIEKKNGSWTFRPRRSNRLLT